MDAISNLQELVNNSTSIINSESGALSKCWLTNKEGKKILIKGCRLHPITGEELTQPICEVMTSKIYKALGINTVEYFLIKDTNNLLQNTYKGYVSVCSNMLKDGENLIQFNKVYKDLIGTPEKKIKLLDNIIKSDISLYSYFKDVLTADALVGNIDRHLGNISYVTNYNSPVTSLSKVYDLGDSLLSNVSDNMISKSYAKRIEDNAKPFAATHKSQIDLVGVSTDVISKMEYWGICEIINLIEYELSLLTVQRRNAIIEYLKWRYYWLLEEGGKNVKS